MLQPTGYIHSLALLEAAEYVAAKCAEAGYTVSLKKNRVSPTGVNIIFGGHLEPEKVKKFPENIVIFNTEQLTADSVWTKAAYIEVLKSRYVFDYSPTNLACIPHENKWLISFLFCKTLKRLPKNPTPESDLLFFGSLNERRMQVLHALGHAGLRISCAHNVYSSPRDEFMVNARAVLNLHFYESQIFQQIRAFYPLINEIPVISENFSNESAPDIYNEVVFTPGDRSLVDYIVSLDLSSERFNQECLQRFSLFERYNEDEEFAYAIDAVVRDLCATRPRTFVTPLRPTLLNLGSGKDYRIGFFNVDVNPAVAPDALLDLSKEHTFPIEIANHEGLSVILEQEQLDEIIAFDVLEHVPDLVCLMTNCLALLKIGGRFTIKVPYDLSLGAWQDPTHIRAFNENSWLYFTEWSWYLGWKWARFDLVELKYELSQIGQSMLDAGRELNEIQKIPRTIDAMWVVLQKRLQTVEERTLAISYSGDL